MKSFSRLTVLLASILFSAAFLITSFVDQSILKNNLQIILNEKIEGDFTINGEVSLSLLPTPRITIKDATLENAIFDGNLVNIEMEKLIAKFNIGVLMGSELKVNNLKAVSPVMEMSFIKVGIDVTKPAKEVKKSDAPIKEEVTPKDKIESKIEGKEETKVVQVQSEDKAASLEVKELVYVDDSFLSKIFNIKGSNKDAFDVNLIKKVEVLNGYFKKVGIGGEVILDAKNINFTSKNDFANKSFGIDGALLINKIPTQFELLVNTNENEDSKLTVNSPILKLELEGQFYDSNFSNLLRSSFSGRLQANIVNPKEFFNKYLSTYNLAYGKVNSVAAIELNAEIDSKKGKYKISNIKLDSQVISGAGYVNADLSSKDAIIDSKIDIANADIDSLWSARFVGHGREIIDLERTIMEDFLGQSNIKPGQTFILKNNKTLNKKEDPSKKPIFNSFKMDFGVKIKKAKYLGKFLDDVDVSLVASKNGNLEISKAKMKIPDGGILEIAGVFQKTNNVSNFIGNYKIDGKDLDQFLSWVDLKSKILRSNPGVKYDLSGEIIILSNFLALKKLLINLENGKNIIKGNIRYDNSKDMQSVNSLISIDKMDLNDYFNISFERNKYLAPGSLSKKLIWLNTVKAENDVSIKVGELKYLDHVFLNQDLNFTTSPRVFNLNDLKIKSEDKEIDFNLSLLANIESDPTLNLDLEFNNFKYLSGELEDNQKHRRLPFSTRFFFLPVLSDFSGEVKIKSNKFAIDDLEIEDLNLEGTLNKGVISVKDGSLKIYDGDLKYDGEIVVRKVKSINGSFTLSQANNAKLLKNIFGLTDVEGLSNISGVFNGGGENTQNFVKSIKSKVNFVGANVRVNNFGLSELLKKTLLAGYSKDKVGDTQKILFNENYSTMFKNVKGSLEISPTKANNKLKITANALGINSVTLGGIDLPSNSFEGLSKIIFLSGTRKKQVPINIAISHKGKLSSLSRSANLEQVDQYLSKIEKSNAAK